MKKQMDGYSDYVHRSRFLHRFFLFLDYGGDPRTEAIRRFNDFVASDPRFETVILPIRDGMTLLHLKE